MNLPKSNHAELPSRFPLRIFSGIKNPPQHFFTLFLLFIFFFPFLQQDLGLYLRAGAVPAEASQKALSGPGSPWFKHVPAQPLSRKAEMKSTSEI